MSFGFSISDAVLLVNLAWSTVQKSRKACGEYDELTREVSSLHVVLQRLHEESKKPESPLNKPDDTLKEELGTIVFGCRKTLRVLDKILAKYNALSSDKRSSRKLWQQIRFGNGQIATLLDQRSMLTYYTSALSLFLNTVSTGTLGRIECQLNNAGGDLKELRLAVNSITAHLLSKSNQEGSVLTAYADDDRKVWREFRRELIGDGFSSRFLHKHKGLIKAYIQELGDRGLLDDQLPESGELSPNTRTCSRTTKWSETVANGLSSQSREGKHHECTKFEQPFNAQAGNTSNEDTSNGTLPMESRTNADEDMVYAEGFGVHSSRDAEARLEAELEEELVAKRDARQRRESSLGDLILYLESTTDIDHGEGTAADIEDLAEKGGGKADSEENLRSSLAKDVNVALKNKNSIAIRRQKSTKNAQPPSPACQKVGFLERGSTALRMDNSAISNKTQVSDHISECVGIMSSLEMGQHSVIFQPDAKLMFSEASGRLLVMKAGRPLLVWFQEVMTLLHYYLLLNPCGAADHDHRRRPTWHMSDIVLSEAPKDHCRFYKVGYMVFCDIEREYRRRFLEGTLLGLNQRGFKNENEVHQQILRDVIRGRTSFNTRHSSAKHSNLKRLLYGIDCWLLIYVQNYAADVLRIVVAHDRSHGECYFLATAIQFVVP